MKVSNLIKGTAALLLIGVMASCGGKNEQERQEGNITLLPVKTSDTKWGFMNDKGEIVIDGAFKNEPSTPYNGVFYVMNDDYTYTLYQLDGKDYKDIVNKLASVGYLEDGLIPVAPKGKGIKVINKKGEDQFELDKKYKSAHKKYSDGLLGVSKDGKWGFINKKGEEVIKPTYDAVMPFAGGKAAAAKLDNNGNIRFYVINKNGEELLKLKDKYNNINPYVESGNILATLSDNGDDRYVILDMKGEEKYKLPEKVQRINDNGFDGEYIIYRNDGLYGVMNIKGEDIVRPRYESIQFADGNFLAEKDNNYVLVNNKGEETQVYDYKNMARVGRFGFMAKDGNSYILVDKEGKQKGKSDVKRYEMSLPDGIIYSDYDEPVEVAEEVVDYVY